MDNMNGGFNPNDMNNNNGMNNVNNSMNTMNNTNGGFNPNGMNGSFNPNGMNSGFNPNGMNNMGFNQMNQMGGGPGLAIASMVLGILSLLFCGGWLSLVVGVVGLALGGVAFNKNTRGRGMAIAGLTCSIVGVASFVIWVLFVEVFAVDFIEDIFEDVMLNM